MISRVAAADRDVLGHHPAALLERQPVPLALLVERVDDAVLALGGADLGPRLRVRVGRGLGHRQVGVGDRHPLRQPALGEDDVEGVDVVEHRALGEQHQVGVAARADGRVGAQAAVDGVVLAGGEELPFILRPRLGVATLPGGIELEEGELGKRAIGHRRDASGTRVRVGSARRRCKRRPGIRRRPARRDRGVAVRDHGRGDRRGPGVRARRDQRRARRGAGRADVPRHRPGQPRQRDPLRRDLPRL